MGRKPKLRIINAMTVLFFCVILNIIQKCNDEIDFPPLYEFSCNLRLLRFLQRRIDGFDETSITFE